MALPALLVRARAYTGNIESALRDAVRLATVAGVAIELEHEGVTIFVREDTPPEDLLAEFERVRGGGGHLVVLPWPWTVCRRVR